MRSEMTPYSANQLRERPAKRAIFSSLARSTLKSFDISINRHVNPLCRPSLEYSRDRKERWKLMQSDNKLKQLITREKLF